MKSEQDEREMPEKGSRKWAESQEGEAISIR